MKGIVIWTDVDGVFSAEPRKQGAPCPQFQGLGLPDSQ